MRSTDRVMVEADDPIAPGELQALARQQGWQFAATGEHRFLLTRPG